MTRGRSILFSGAMVLAILDDRKTQTRRVIKLDGWNVGDPIYQTRRSVEKMCPYGQPGDLLYVRETWRTWAGHDELRPSQLDSYGPCQYKADMAVYNGHRDWGRWRSSIHMPEWASRIWLRMTDVRVGRVQEISVVDVEAEGVMEINPYDYGERDDTPRGRFGCLWDSINAPRGYGWDKNPWVWMITFERKQAR